MQSDIDKRKVYGRDARVRELRRRLEQDKDKPLPEMCVDMMYAIMISF